jgi:hypothetical protein
MNDIVAICSANAFQAQHCNSRTGLKAMKQLGPTKIVKSTVLMRSQLADIAKVGSWIVVDRPSSRRPRLNIEAELC